MRLLSDTPPEPNQDTLVGLIADRWRRGWLPLDVIRSLPSDDKVATAIVVDLITIDRSGWHAACAPVWREQADQLGATTRWWASNRPWWPQFVDRHHGSSPEQLATVALVLELMLESPASMPVVAPPPWERDDATSPSNDDDAMLAKVRALLAKAESSTYPAEAEALSAKAQSLISQHSIDQALLADTVDVPGATRVYVEAPYTKPKFLLLSSIAEANDCRCVWNAKTATAHLFGYDHDIKLVVLLFTSLLVQGTRAVLAPDEPIAKKHIRSWRNSFWIAFADRVGERLRSITDASRATAISDRSELLPVLASRAEAVESAVRDAFPQLGTMRISLSNAHGARAGARFADRAQLDAPTRLGTTPQIGRR